MRVPSRVRSQWARWSGSISKRSNPGGVEEAPGGIEETLVFRQRLALEVERASRLGRPFAVIALGRGGHVDRSELSRLAAPLQARLRATDTLGWLGPHELGLLLRYTSSEDAVGVAEEICVLLDARGAPALHCTVFAFPPAALQSAIDTRASKSARAEPAQ
jgi:hypothetical protein